MNTENIVTKLYAYGSYGDKTNGYCGIDECTHTEYVYTVTADCAVGTYWFAYEDETNVRVVKHFDISAPLKTGDVLIFSTMDPSTMLYSKNLTSELPELNGYGWRYMISQTGQADKETNLQAAITLQKGSQSVAFDPISIPIIRIWESVTLQASVTTKVNLCSDSEPITMTIVLSSPQTYSLYMKENSYINLTCKNPKTSSEDMICKVHFIP